METTETRVERGQFVWHELLTEDVDAAIDFYTKVIGWTTQKYTFEDDAGPDYTMWLAGEVPVGGIMLFDRQTMGDMSAGWSATLNTTDVDGTVREATNLGARVLIEPADLPTVGRVASLSDPQGAVFSVLKPSGPPMPEPPEVRSFSWNELATTDYEAAFDFYRRLFDWRQWDDLDMGDGLHYRMFGHGEKMYGGMYTKPPDMLAPPHWLHYVKVDELDGTLDRLRRHGGQVVMGPDEVPGGDRVAQCVDSQGFGFGLHEAKK